MSRGGLGWVVWCFSPLFTSKGAKEKKGGGGLVDSHNRRKPARGIPQAALTHRLEVSGATRALTAALHRVQHRRDGKIHHFYILTYLNILISIFFDELQILTRPGLLTRFLRQQPWKSPHIIQWTMNGPRSTTLLFLLCCHLYFMTDTEQQLTDEGRNWTGSFFSPWIMKRGLEKTPQLCSKFSSGTQGGFCQPLIPEKKPAGWLAGDPHRII